jgi:hypothetical protein
MSQTSYKKERREYVIKFGFTITVSGDAYMMTPTIMARVPLVWVRRG